MVRHRREMRWQFFKLQAIHYSLKVRLCFIVTTV